jgi:hypothetical protein
MLFFLRLSLGSHPVRGREEIHLLRITYSNMNTESVHRRSGHEAVAPTAEGRKSEKTRGGRAAETAAGYGKKKLKRCGRVMRDV